MPSSLAALAKPAHDQLGTLRAEATTAGGAEGAGRLDPHIQIFDRAAGSTDEVVVPFGSWVPQGGRAAGGNPVRDAQLLEQLESGVDGRQPGVRESRLHAGEHLLGGRMSAEIGERAVDEDALGGDSKPAFPESPFKLLVSH
jgi:hypothetical protein